MIEKGSSCVVKRDVAVGGALAFRKGEIVIVREVRPHPGREKYRYLTYSARLKKYYLLSHDELVLESPAGSEKATAPPAPVGQFSIPSSQIEATGAILDPAEEHGTRGQTAPRREKASPTVGAPVPRASYATAEGFPLKGPGKAGARRGKLVAVLLAAGILIVAALSSQALRKENGAEQPQEGTGPARPAVEEGVPEASFERLVSLSNIQDGQQVHAGTVTVSGKVERGVSLSLNGEPVGILPDTLEFHHPVAVSEGQNSLVFNASWKGKDYSKTLTVTGVISPEEFKASCPPGPPYAVLKKNPEAHAGTRCHYRGKVVQIMESGNYTVIRADITYKGYGFWTDTIFITYAGTTPAVEDNIVVVYGTIMGSKTYESVAGWNITIPWVEARYIDVVG